MLVSGGSRPALIVNADQADTLWIGSSNDVLPGSIDAVPISPNGFLSVDGSEDVYGVGDPASIDNGVFVYVIPGGMSFFQLFTQLVIAGPDAGLFIYSPSPGLGNLVGSWMSVATVDVYGNVVPEGLNLVGDVNSTNVFSITSSIGATVAAVDAIGNLSATSLSSDTDVLIGGQSTLELLQENAQGLLSFGKVTVPFPSSGTFSTAAEFAFWELDQVCEPGRTYRVRVSSGLISVAGAAFPVRMVLNLRFTSDGTTPTTSSTLIGGGGAIVSASGQVTPFTGCEWTFTPTVEAVYRFLVSGWVTAGAGFTWTFTSVPVYMTIEDIGPSVNNAIPNNILLIGSGTSGGGSAQNFTETFYPSNTWSYYSNFGLRNTNGDMFHGAYQGEAPAYQYSYIQWGVGSRGNNLNTVLNFAVNSVMLRLTNEHSWFNSGMRFGLHSSTVLGGAQGVYSTILNAGGTGINEGQTKSYPLSSTMWAPFKAAGVTYLVLSPDSGNLANLNWYGYFSGKGNVQSQQPQLVVNYVH